MSSSSALDDGILWALVIILIWVVNNALDDAILWAFVIVLIWVVNNALDDTILWTLGIILIWVVNNNLDDAHMSRKQGFRWCYSMSAWYHTHNMLFDDFYSPKWDAK